VAHRLSLNARAGNARRGCRERSLTSLAGTSPEPDDESLLEKNVDPHADPQAEVARRELRWVIDDELGRLPEKYRAPVVLCYLEGMTNEEAARRLGWPTGSMSRRLERGRSLLRQRLANRGLPVAIVLLIALIGLVGTLRPVSPTPRSGPGPLALAPLHTPRQTGRSLEDLLSLLAKSEASASSSPEALSEARATYALADQLVDQHPSRTRSPWRQFTGAMRPPALLLARAALDGDDVQVLTAARRLKATCLGCHVALR
jgi:RNA polymerase sigma-70 factor (ECF subfamily)